jgi:Bacterial Ig-like domain
MTRFALVAALLAVMPPAETATSAVSRRQPMTRLATTVEALLTYPIFFHGRDVVLQVTVEKQDGRLSLVSPSGERRIHAVARSTQPDDGPAEVRGEFWDLGRLQQDDPRLTGFDVDGLVERVNGGRWPGQNQIFVVAVELAGPPAPLPSAQAATVRAIALNPEKFEGQKVTVTGRFRGVNLYGDQPQSPSRSRYDFVLQSADAALWVTGLQPKGKNFSLDRNARVDTGRWLEITGTVGRSAGLVWIDAEKLALSTAPEPAAVVEVEVPKIGPAPEVSFSLPTTDDTDVETSMLVRIQFTRDMDAATLRDKVRVRYATPPAQGSPESPPSFTTAYREGTKVLEIKFAGPLDRFRVVEVELLEGIAAFDGAKLATPWTLRFTTGAK